MQLKICIWCIFGCRKNE